MHGLDLPDPSPFRFGPFEADLAAGELRKDGVKVRLEGQPLRILALLLRRRGQLVTRGEIRQELWPAETFVDFEHSINDGVKRLRSALGDSATVPQYIATLPRRGYRFIAPIESPRAREAPPERLPDQARPHPLLHSLLVVTAFALAAVGVGSYRSAEAPIVEEPPPGIRSLAVLPLKNLSGDVEQDFLAEGMTDLLITHLGKIGTLRVISHQSVAGYRGTSKPMPQIARELGVDALLEGSVIRLEDRIRVTANLVQAVPERHLSAESYELDQRDILTVQRDVARAVARVVRIKLTAPELERLARTRAVDPRAFEAYRRGRHSWQQRTTGASLKTAI